MLTDMDGSLVTHPSLPCIVILSKVQFSRSFHFPPFPHESTSMRELQTGRVNMDLLYYSESLPAGPAHSAPILFG